jgi:pSer/pThr/pTyr-binding forkhead associated (FHA) protein
MAVCPNGHDSVTDDVCDVCGTRIARSSGVPAADRGRLTGKHHAGGPRPTGSPEDTCPWCGSPSSSQFCPRCGFRVRRPFAPLAVPESATDPEPSPLAAVSQSWSDLPSDVTSWSAVPASPSPLDPPVPSDRPAFLDWFKAPDRDREPEPEPELEFEPERAPEPAPEPEPEPEPEPAPVVPPRSSAAAPTTPIPKFTPTTWSVVLTSDRAYYDQMQVERARMGWDLAFPAYTAERRIALTGKQMRIGRRSAARGTEPEIDLAVPPADPGISRLHALLIAAADGTWAVLDPGSANGTLLNGREIAPGDLIPLHDGDRINLGAWTAITVRHE